MLQIVTNKFLYFDIDFYFIYDIIKMLIYFKDNKMKSLKEDKIEIQAKQKAKNPFKRLIFSCELSKK